MGRYLSFDTGPTGTPRWHAPDHSPSGAHGKHNDRLGCAWAHLVEYAAQQQDSSSGWATGTGYLSAGLSGNPLCPHRTAGYGEAEAGASIFWLAQDDEVVAFPLTPTRQVHPMRPRARMLRGRHHLNNLRNEGAHTQAIFRKMRKHGNDSIYICTSDIDILITDIESI